MKRFAAGWLTLSVVLVGAVLLTVGHRIVQNQLYEDITEEPISDRQRAYVETQTTTSASLFNLAFGALVGLVSLQVYGKRSQRPTGILPMIAAALLALSMYASFLLQTRLALALGRGPLRLLVGAGVEFPLTAQFWLFVVAVLMLLFWVFPGRGIAGIALAAGLLLPTSASAQEPALGRCVTQWSADRRVPVPPEVLPRVERVLNGVTAEARITLDTSSRCAFVESMLDEFRRRVVAEGRAEVEAPSAALVEAIRLAADTVDSHSFSAGDVISRLMAMAQVWNGPSGLLVVRSTTGTLYVIATRLGGGPADWKGFTNWTVRLPANAYRVQVMKDGVQVGPAHQIDLADSQRLELRFP